MQLGKRICPPKALLVLPALILCGIVGTEAMAAEPATFFEGVGLQLYSLRNEFPKDVPGTLDQVRGWGVRYVELAGTYNLPPEKFRAMLQQRGLEPIGMHFPYNQFRDDVEGIAREAKALGLKYVGCAYIGHKAPFDEAQCLQAADVFNRAGEALAKHGLKFYYHNHGYEFRPYGDGTLFDLLVTKTNPQYVSFQLDVLWAFLPGQDPVKLLEKYPNRWLLLHLKDLRKGVPTNEGPKSSTALTNDVALGTGQVDWAPLVRAAMKVGVKYYFIEDESPSAVEQIPESLKFVKQLKY
jgi:sugar phosphate isomerase/epimerase